MLQGSSGCAAEPRRLPTRSQRAPHPAHLRMLCSLFSEARSPKLLCGLCDDTSPPPPRRVPCMPPCVLCRVGEGSAPSVSSLGDDRQLVCCEREDSYCGASCRLGLAGGGGVPPRTAAAASAAAGAPGIALLGAAAAASCSRLPATGADAGRSELLPPLLRLPSLPNSSPYRCLKYCCRRQEGAKEQRGESRGSDAGIAAGKEARPGGPHVPCTSAIPATPCRPHPRPKGAPPTHLWLVVGGVALLFQPPLQVRRQAGTRQVKAGSAGHRGMESLWQYGTHVGMAKTSNKQAGGHLQVELVGFIVARGGARQRPRHAGVALRRRQARCVQDYAADVVDNGLQEEQGGSTGREGVSRELPGAPWRLCLVTHPYSCLFCTPRPAPCRTARSGTPPAAPTQEVTSRHAPHRAEPSTALVLPASTPRRTTDAAPAASCTCEQSAVAERWRSAAGGGRRRRRRSASAAAGGGGGRQQRRLAVRGGSTTSPVGLKREGGLLRTPSTYSSGCSHLHKVCCLFVVHDVPQAVRGQDLQGQEGR